MTTNSKEEPPAKRSRQEAGECEAASLPTKTEDKESISIESEAQSQSSSSPLDIFSPKIFEKSDEFVKTYNDAQPYPHGVLDELFVNGYAGKLSPPSSKH